MIGLPDSEFIGYWHPYIIHVKFENMMHYTSHLQYNYHRRVYFIIFFPDHAYMYKGTSM